MTATWPAQQLEQGTIPELRTGTWRTPKAARGGEAARENFGLKIFGGKKRTDGTSSIAGRLHSPRAS